MVLSGVCLAGLTTIEQPAASAGAIFHTAIRSGKFHGRIASAIPAGSLTISGIASSPVRAILPKVLSANSAYQRKKAGASVPTSCKQLVIVFPASMLSRTASSSLCCSTSAASFKRVYLRYSGAERGHVPSLKTRQPAATARSTSAALQWAKLVMILPVAGFEVSSLLLLIALQ